MKQQTLKPTLVIWHESSKLNQESTKTLLVEYWPNYSRDESAIAAAVIDKGALLVQEGCWVHFDHLIRFTELEWENE